MESVHENNFDLIRLFAAGQVAILHIVKNMGIALPPPLEAARSLLEFFPGVPIFFVTSGFLISASFERKPHLGSYVLARILRIYPALWVATALSVAAALFFMSDASDAPTRATSADVARWVAAQLTVAQFYAPFSIREASGVGHPNGSLWTIPVELQFYIALPFLMVWLGRGAVRGSQAKRLVGLVVVAYAASAAYLLLREAIQKASPDFAILVRVTLVPYLYMFLLGICFQSLRHRGARLLHGKALYWIVAYSVVAFVEQAGFGFAVGTNTPELLSMTILAAAVVSAAYTRRTASARLLRGNDISYGLYVYHMIVVNIAIALGASAQAPTGIAVFIAAMALAVLSWLLVERPALRLKSRLRNWTVSPLPVGAGARS